MKTAFGYTPTYTSAEVFELYRQARSQADSANVV